MRQLPIKLDKSSSKLKSLNYLFLLLISLLTSPTIEAQQLAFPTAEGYGRFVSGGRGGKVIYVTNLNDSGAGRFRAALTDSGPRTVVFNVSGTLTLNSPISVKNGDLTIAGQTSPNGITIRRHPVYISADNVIIRYLRFRLGGEAGKSGYDALSIRGISHNVSGVMVDHCSISWARDECFSVVGTPYDANDPPYYGVTNVTLQWSFVTEGLKGHAFGGFVKYQATKISVIKNLFANNTQRNPNINGATGSVTNNIVYNWAGRGLTVDNTAKLNIIGNYAKVGPTVKKVEQGYMVIGGQGGTPSDNQLYVKGNYHSQRRTNPNDNNEWSVFDPDNSEAKHRKSSPHNYNEGIKVLSAFDAYDKVLEDGGASIFRDAVDKRIVNQVKSGTGQNDIASPASVGGWPSIAMGSAYPDQDKDGMDDNWEKAVGLDPNKADDRNGDRNGDGYTNLEEFLNCVIPGDCESSAPVNTAPAISSMGDQEIDENTTLGPLNFTVGDSETDANTLTVTATSGNQSLLANEDIVLGGNGTQRTITLTPKSDETGTTEITLKVSDGNKETSTSFSVTVNDVIVNTPPTITGINDQSIDENTSTSVINFTIDDEESEAGELTVTASSDNPALVSNNGITLGGSGKERNIKVSPENNKTGTANITVTVSDGDKNTSASFVLTVNEVVKVNTPPTITDIDDQSIDANTSTDALNFTIGDDESDADKLTVTASSGNQALVGNNGITLGGSGKERNIKVSPKDNKTGSAQITITVSDGDKKTSKAFTVMVKKVITSNTVPTISDIEDLSIGENSCTRKLSFTVGDAETGPGDLMVTATSSNQSLVKNSDIELGGSGAERNIRISPQKDQTGITTIVVQVSDGEMHTSEAFTVTVNTILDKNTPPTISEIKNQVISMNKKLGPLCFKVGDEETPAKDLVVRVKSSNQRLVPNNRIFVKGSGESRSITICPRQRAFGSCKITIEVADESAITKESFNLEISAISSMPGWLRSKLKIYPNPFSNYIKVDTREVKRRVDVMVYDLRGRIRKKACISKTRSNRSSLKMDLSSLESGTYYLKVRYDGAKATSILVKRSF